MNRATGTVSMTTTMGLVTGPKGIVISGLTGGIEFVTLAEARYEPKGFFKRVAWWSRLYVGGPQLFLIPVAPPDRVPVRARR